MEITHHRSDSNCTRFECVSWASPRLATQATLVDDMGDSFRDGNVTQAAVDPVTPEVFPERKGSVRPQPDRGGGHQPRRNGPPFSSSWWQREAHQKRPCKLHAHAAEVGGRYQCCRRSDPTFPALREAPQTSPGATGE